MRRGRTWSSPAGCCGSRAVELTLPPAAASRGRARSPAPNTSPVTPPNRRTARRTRTSTTTTATAQPATIRTGSNPAQPARAARAAVATSQLATRGGDRHGAGVADTRARPARAAGTPRAQVIASAHRDRRRPRRRARRPPWWRGAGPARRPGRPSTTTVATTPAGPDVPDFMTESERSLSYDAVSPSATSDRPSQCSARLPAASAPTRDERRPRAAAGRAAGRARRPRRRPARERQHGQRGEQHRAPGWSSGRRCAGAAHGDGRQRPDREPPGVGRWSSGRDLGEQRDVAQQRRPRCAARDRGDGAAALAEPHARGRGSAPGRAWPARATAPARWSGARRRTRRPRRARAGRRSARRPRTSARRAAPVRRPRRRSRGSRWRPRGRRCRARSGSRPGRRRGSPTRASACVDDAGLAGQRDVVDAGAAAGDLARRAGRARRRPSRPRAWCCRCPCRR